MLSTILFLLCIASTTASAQIYTLRSGKLVKSADVAPTGAPPLEWQYWIFSTQTPGRIRANVVGVISASTRDSLEMQLATVRTLREAAATIKPDESSEFAYDSLLGPVAVYDERNDYGGIVAQGIRALSKFVLQRRALQDALRVRIVDSTSQALFDLHTRALVRTYEAHYRAQNRVDRGDVLRDMSLVHQLDSTLNALSRQQNEIRLRIAGMRAAGKSSLLR